MTKTETIRRVFREQGGILKLIPVFVPRRFSKPGRRLRLHPDDYYALGVRRGAIKERWFSSVITCMNGELAAQDEGLSYVAVSQSLADKITLKDFVAELKGELIGSLYDTYGTWPMYSKFFDYEDPLFHHVHLDFEAAARVGRLGKPECYYYPPQMNNYAGNFPHTYFGFSPEVTKARVREALVDFETRDTRITELSRAYRIQLGTGWYTPPGVIHAPGSYLTYEPQWNSDVNSVYENITAGEVNPREMLAENCPRELQRDPDYILSLLDWEKNVDPDYRNRFLRLPLACPRCDEHYTEAWIAYDNPYLGAKELTVQPGCTVTVRDSAAYGCILVQGFGTVGLHRAETAGMLRFGQMSADEFFVGQQAAEQGVVISNHSQCEPLVMLKHFGPNHKDMPRKERV